MQKTRLATLAETSDLSNQPQYVFSSSRQPPDSSSRQRKRLWVKIWSHRLALLSSTSGFLTCMKNPRLAACCSYDEDIKRDGSGPQNTVGHISCRPCIRFGMCSPLCTISDSKTLRYPISQILHLCLLTTRPTTQFFYFPALCTTNAKNLGLTSHPLCVTFQKASSLYTSYAGSS